MKFSWFIALRYLKPKGTFVSVITLISVAGVALGVGVLLVVIAVMSGFEKKIKEELLKSEPALVVQNPDRDFPDAPAPVVAEAKPAEAPVAETAPAEPAAAPAEEPKPEAQA